MQVQAVRHSGKSGQVGTCRILEETQAADGCKAFWEIWAGGSRKSF